MVDTGATHLSDRIVARLGLRVDKGNSRMLAVNSEAQPLKESTATRKKPIYLHDSHILIFPQTKMTFHWVKLFSALLPVGSAPLFLGANSCDLTAKGFFTSD